MLNNQKELMKEYIIDEETYKNLMALLQIMLGEKQALVPGMALYKLLDTLSRASVKTQKEEQL